jgi:hypothetical protein
MRRRQVRQAIESIAEVVVQGEAARVLNGAAKV